jgi:hypothetical protein
MLGGSPHPKVALLGGANTTGHDLRGVALPMGSKDPRHQRDCLFFFHRLMEKVIVEPCPATKPRRNCRIKGGRLIV